MRKKTYKITYVGPTMLFPAGGQPPTEVTVEEDWSDFRVTELENAVRESLIALMRIDFKWGHGADFVRSAIKHCEKVLDNS